jgi:precorrin-6A/cobalt-precorrin-6A reductase
MLIARPMRILILGGTAEARQLGERLAGRSEYSAVLSLAGRTAAPAGQAVPVRIGGFGGAAGLADYLRGERIDLLIDATHPYAATISANAVHATTLANRVLLVLRRSPWEAVAGDRWAEVGDSAEAVPALGEAPRAVFLALGRQEIAPFAAAPQHRYLVRSVDPVDPPLAVPRAVYITGRGPFPEADERVLLGQHRIEVIVAKNSGGAASYGKIAAARALGLPVVMLRRPAPPEMPARPGLPQAATVATVAEAMAFLDHALLTVPRGV